MSSSNNMTIIDILIFSKEFSQTTHIYPFYYDRPVINGLNKIIIMVKDAGYSNMYL